MENVVIVLGIVLSLFSSVIIITFNKKRKLHKYILAGIFLIFSWYNFIYLFVLNSWILDFPYFLRIGRPFYLAIPPLSYLYIKHIVLKKNKFVKSDILHFIPSLVVIADVGFYYLNSYSLADDIAFLVVNNLKDAYQLASGFIPGEFFLTAKAVQGIIYAGVLWHLLYLASKRKLLNSLSDTKKRWLFVFSILMTALYLSISYTALSPFVNAVNGDGAASPMLNPGFISRLLLLTIITALFFFPSIMYSTGSRSVDDSKETEERGSQALSISPERLQEYIKRIDALNNDSRFFKSNITIAQLAQKLEIPPRFLTYILNRHYQMRYTDFINGHRIRYIITQFGTGFLKELTMEAIAYEAGFSSRSAFFSAFKKYTGKSPSQYLKDREISVSRASF